MATTRKATASARGTRSKTGARRARSESTPVDGAHAALRDKNLAKLHEIVKLLESSTLAELRYEDADVTVEVRRHSTAPAPQPAPVAAPAPSPDTNGAVAPAVDANVHVVRSPFVGTFYASPSPGAEKFTEVGKAIRRGQTLCIIEAMKLMNEIESEVDGVVLEMLAENGKPVQYGDALFKIKTKG